MSTSKTAKLALWCPTYKRPGKLQEVADNVRASTKTDFQLYWGCEPEDTASIEAAKATGFPVIINKYGGDAGYSNTIQTIYESTKEPIAFHINDDFYFPDGWDVPHIKYLDEHPEVMVLGAHDGYERTIYWTISFIRRKYIEEQSGVIDIPNRVFYPYHHNFQDTEFSKTAVKRGVWDRIEIPCIEHRRTGDDETYQKNAATYEADSILFNKRERLFW